MGQSLLGIAEVSRDGFSPAAIRRLASSRASVLITGESGVGKERIARQIHNESGCTGDFVAINCATLSSGTAAAELFGHERGAFTGAYKPSVGMIRAAHRGSLFLDEVGELPSEVQSLLLRALQERVARPVGATKEVQIEVRIISATNAPLAEWVRQSRFRLDLYARLSELVIHVAPLRARREEILCIFAEIATEEGLSLHIQARAAEAMLLHPWPTNIRGLQRIVRHIKCYQPTCAELTPELLAACDTTIDEVQTIRSSSDAVGMSSEYSTLRSRDALQTCINECGGNISEVARKLGTGRNQVYRWMNRLGLASIDQSAALAQALDDHSDRLGRRRKSST